MNQPCSEVLFEFQKLTASDASSYARFGSAVAVSGEHAIIGASEDYFIGGSIYFYQLAENGWTEVDRIHGGEAEETFGRYVAIDGEIAVASGNGVAYVYQKDENGWSQATVLSPHDLPNNSGIGGHVAISGNRILAGARFDNDYGSWTGAAYVFEYKNGVWCETAKLFPSDADQQKLFGISLALSEDTAIIASRGEFGVYMGAAYIFEKGDNGWVEVAKFSGTNPLEYFGQSVAVCGEYVAIGSMGKEGKSTGAVYMLERHSGIWETVAQLTASDAEIGDLFGQSVSLYGQKLAVGASGNDDYGSLSGSAYLFSHMSGVWTEEAKLLPSDGADHDFFGQRVSISDNWVFVGSNDDDDAGRDSGSVYVYEYWQYELVHIEVSTINLKSKGRCPVAVMSTDDFDAATIDPSTVRFAGAAPVHYALEDADGDGDIDIKLHFKTADLDIDPTAAEVTLIGQTHAGQLVVGMDSIKIVGQTR